MNYEYILLSNQWKNPDGVWRRSIKVEDSGFCHEFPTSISYENNYWNFKVDYVRTGIRDNCLRICAFDSHDFLTGYSKMVAKVRKFAKNIGVDLSKTEELSLSQNDSN